MIWDGEKVGPSPGTPGPPGPLGPSGPTGHQRPQGPQHPKIPWTPGTPRTISIVHGQIYVSLCSTYLLNNQNYNACFLTTCFYRRVWING